MPVGESDKRPQRACYHWAPECLHLRATGSPMISSVTRRSYKSLCLSADRVYTFGRGKSWCDFYFRDRRVSRRHCQVLFDGYEHKVFIIDGTFSSSSDLKTDEVRETLGEGEACASWKGSNRSLNGVYVNCSRLKGRAIFQLSVGDVVSFVCGDSSSSIGFVIDRIVLTDGTVWGNNMDSAYRSADQSCCDLQSVQDQCLLSVYDRLSKLYLSRTPSPGKVISRKTTFTDAELSQDSIDSLCGRLVQISRHLKQPKNSCSRRRKVHYFEVDQRSGYSPLHGESKIGGTGGEASGGFTDTNSLLIVLNTFEKRSLKRSRFCQMDSDRDLILRALLLLKKCKFARKKLNHTVYFNNSFRNSSALVGRKRSNTEPLINCSFPLKANRGIFNHFNRLDALQKGTDCIASDAILSDNGGNNLVADTSSIGIERNDEIVKHTSCCNLSPAKEKLKNGSVCLRELDRCTKVPSVDIELNENYSVGNRKEQIENSCEIPGISALDGSTGKEARVCFIGYSQENSVIHHKMTLRHGIANEGNSVDCTPSVPHMSSVTGLHSNFVDENIEGLKLSKGIHAPESDGKMLFLNRLEFMNIRSTERPASVSLPELLSPVDSLSRIFIATFTSDIWWFLSACKIPNDLPITVACHNADRCWNPAHEQRWSQPYAQYPNLVAVYPPFPDEISITKDKKKRGVACHHPKLFLLLRDESICVVITSANLVPKQWNNVTNTIWWQDFPRRNSPDFSSLFTCSRGEREEISEDSKSDFLAQLAGFVSSLVVDIPNQAYWIKELCNYDFRKASGHLVSSIPGIHESMFPSNLEHVHYLTELQPIHQTATRSLKFVGSVLASLVGLSHRFQAKVDPSGARLKALASVIQKCSENVYGMLEVKLQRNHCIPADSSAVSVVINYPAECLEDGACHEDRLQLGFLPRSVAKWVAPLCDAALFSFSAYVFPRELLAAALSGSNSKVKLVLYVSQGPNFSKISNLIQHAHVVAICYLLVSIQRSHGIWRLHEVLSKYQWPDSEELDFVYGASSIGSSLNSHFLAAFATAAGKRSSQFLDSEESDPEWGVWSAEHESQCPSIKIIFPTIERVKLGVNGIWPYRHLLSFSERSWQRLRAADILHDAIPYPNERVGHPMHVKVARRRFWNKASSSSCGWIYFGSHNFSAAAWGYPLANFPEAMPASFGSSVLGSRLHIGNYELGIVLIVPPHIPNGTAETNLDLDDIILPFVVPAPKYKPNDRPATMQAMRETCVELEKQATVLLSKEEDLMNEDIDDDEEEEIEVTENTTEEKEVEKLYAERLWSQVDSADT